MTTWHGPQHGGAAIYVLSGFMGFYRPRSGECQLLYDISALRTTALKCFESGRRKGAFTIIATEGLSKGFPGKWPASHTGDSEPTNYCYLTEDIMYFEGGTLRPCSLR